ncbi:hypothetical protein [Actinoplanes sp. NPDC051411]|uniref:hypothetical protein n=1 Tax=Actinoplanes sp. NPDC051411 TaxID=3155522 RepID=UPI003425BDFF
MNGFPRPPEPDHHYPVWVPPPAVPPPPPSPRRWLGGFFIAYFAAGLALLAVGVIAVVVLVLRPPHDDRANAPLRPVASGAGTTEPSAAATLGPQLLTMGKPLAVTGENHEKFEVTVAAGKYRKTACNEYAVKPRNGGYLPATVRVKVLDGVPDVSEFDFRFQKPDGEWLDSVGGSGCETTGSTGLFRRLTAGRTYVTTVVFDVPKQPLKGDIVFVWPLQDVIGSWKVG